MIRRSLEIPTPLILSTPLPKKSKKTGISLAPFYRSPAENNNQLTLLHSLFFDSQSSNDYPLSDGEPQVKYRDHSPVPPAP